VLAEQGSPYGSRKWPVRQAEVQGRHGAHYVEAPVTMGVDPGARWAAVVVPAEGGRAGQSRGAKT
ncbi:MAG: hypothetical protein ACRDTT_24225, partial [Pseudonocardiaceae bacterium]